jgi:NAD(P)-dependent dehydrogenase (short-subunit alcohol dehydrogenase family)
MSDPLGPDQAPGSADVRGKVVIVTGATRGIGRGCALHLARLGSSLVVTGRKPERLEEIGAELDALGAPHLELVSNTASRDGAFDMVAQTIGRFGRVDGLVANAQTFRPVTPLEDVTESDMDLLLDTGLKGTLWGMQAVFPHMRDQGWGRIVTMGSAAGYLGAAGYGPYATSKEGIRALTRVAAREWAQHGIVVNCVNPASVAHRAPPADDATPEGRARRAVFDAMYKDHPMGRDGDAEVDIGPVVAFLLSDACRYLTGETFMVDGGGLMRP